MHELQALREVLDNIKNSSSSEGKAIADIIEDMMDGESSPINRAAMAAGIVGEFDAWIAVLKVAIGKDQKKLAEDYIPDAVIKRARDAGQQYVITFPRDTRCSALFMRSPDVGWILREWKTDPADMRSYLLSRTDIANFPEWSEVPPVFYDETD